MNTPVTPDSLKEEGIILTGEAQAFISTDTSLIKINPHNRVINMKRVKKYVEAYKQNMTVPTLTLNPNLVLLDGHHRFLAVRQYNEETGNRMKMSLTIDPNRNIRDVALYNENQVQWKSREWIDYFCSLQYPEYLKLKRLMDEFKLSAGAILTVIHGHTPKGDSGITNRKFSVNVESLSSGNIKIDEYLFRKNFKPVQEIAEYAGIKTVYSFVMAVIPLINSPKYDHSRMMSKMETQGHLLRGCGNKGAFQMAISDIYKYRQRNNIFKYFSSNNNNK